MTKCKRPDKTTTKNNASNRHNNREDVLVKL